MSLGSGARAGGGFVGGGAAAGLSRGDGCWARAESTCTAACSETALRCSSRGVRVHWGTPHGATGAHPVRALRLQAAWAAGGAPSLAPGGRCRLRGCHAAAAGAAAAAPGVSSHAGRQRSRLRRAAAASAGPACCCGCCLRPALCACWSSRRAAAAGLGRRPRRARTRRACDRALAPAWAPRSGRLQARASGREQGTPLQQSWGRVLTFCCGWCAGRLGRRLGGLGLQPLGGESRQAVTSAVQCGDLRSEGCAAPASVLLGGLCGFEIAVQA